MKTPAWLGLVMVACLPNVAAGKGKPPCIETINFQIGGTIVDHTNNHGPDLRIYSPALCEKRDLYVYLPPGYDPKRTYPLLLVLHGYEGDETSLTKYVVKPLDAWIRAGKFPPVIVACPDASFDGNPRLGAPATMYLNSPLGRFQDYLVEDVWDFLMTHYPIRPEREAHVMIGLSMGGFGAYNIAIKHRDRFKIVVGVMPAVNLRWMDCRGNYRANFDPNNWGWRTSADNPREVLGSFFFGLVTVTVGESMYPVFGRGPEAVARAAKENPIEMIDAYKLQPGELDLFIGYVGRDEFNIDAQVESFLYLAKSRGIEVATYYHPTDRHRPSSGVKMIPSVLGWLDERLRTYGMDKPGPPPAKP